MIKTSGKVLLFCVLAIASLWGAMVIYYSVPADFAVTAAWGYLIVSLLTVLFTRTWKLGLLIWGGGFCVVLFLWSRIVPLQDRDWADDNARYPSVTFDGERFTVRNIRNFNYRSETDYDVAYYDETFDLQKLKSVDLIISNWGVKAIAHTILSFGFSDGKRLAVSIETRKEKGEQYSPVAGFFRQFELLYVAADERDIVRLRTNYRNEQVHLYRLNPPPAKIRAVLMDYLGHIDRLSKRAEFYNALTQNCTTSIFFSFQVAAPYPPFSLGILLPGYLDHFIWSIAQQRGLTELQFDEFKTVHHINSRAIDADQRDDFSAYIRAAMPEYLDERWGEGKYGVKEQGTQD